jgi:hypothetical protein
MVDRADVVAAHRQLREANDAAQHLLVVEDKPLSRVGFFLFADTLRAWVRSRTEPMSLTSAPYSCGEPPPSPLSGDTRQPGSNR